MPWTPVRQRVLSLPHRIRYRCGDDPELCRGVRTISSFYKTRAKRAGIANSRTGCVVATQRFDSALRLNNLHFHSLWPDGTFTFPSGKPRTRFRPNDTPLDNDIEQLANTLRHRILRFLRKRGALPAADGNDRVDLDDPPRIATSANLRTYSATAAHPVEQVSFTMCEELLARDGLRVPTELEREYACRAGTTTPWCYGDSAENLAGAANLADASACVIHKNWGGVAWEDGFVLHAPVASFAANPFGLHDMVGNVWEWCGDPFAVSVRAVRGASFLNAATAGRSTYRGGYPPDRRNNDLGVRTARSIVRD